MATELKDEIDELNISDDGSDDSNTDGGDAEDRGDNFVDPELEDDGVEAGDGNDDESAKQNDDKGADGEGYSNVGKADGGPDPEGSIPASRLGEVARVKSAATAIADGLVDGSIDPSVVRDFGGAAAVAKALANKEVSLEDLKTGIGPFQQQDATQPQAKDANTSASWDLDSKYVEYQELVEAGETREAATLLRQINKEERTRERAEEQQVAAQQRTVNFVNQLIADYPVLNDPKSPEHESVMVWANHLQVTKSLTREQALEQAIAKVGLTKDAGNASAVPQGEETPQQRTLRLRKEASVKKAVDAANRQPPPMGLGSTPQGAKQVDIADLDEDSFSRLSREEKAAARGDKL